MQNVRLYIRKVIQENFIPTEAKRMKLKMFIPNNIFKIKDILQANGHELYIVGGAVRDALLGKKPKDYDLVTDATYEEIQSLFKNQPFVKKFLTIGEKFAISFLITTDGDYELATYRSDVGGGRKSTVKYEKSLKKDVERRDFTINAMAYDIDTQEVVDYVGGLDDIQNGVLNAVGKPEERFIDDPLRKLRAVRFAARTNSSLSKDTEKALLDSNSMVDINGGIVSRERRKEEFFKGIKTAKTVKYYLSLLKKFHLLEKIFEGIPINYNSVDFFESRNPIIVVAGILENVFNFSDIQKTEKELASLKYSNKNGNMEIPRIIFLLMLNNIWEHKIFDPIAFYNLKKRYLLIQPFAVQDIREFANLKHIDKNFIKALIQFFEYKLTNKDKEEILKNAEIVKGPKFGEKIKEKEYDFFKDIYKKK